MLKRLQRKIALTNIILVGVVITLFFSGYLYISHVSAINSLKSDLTKTVYFTSERNEGANATLSPFDPFASYGQEEPYTPSDPNGAAGEDPFDDNPLDNDSSSGSDDEDEYPSRGTAVAVINTKNSYISVENHGLSLASDEVINNMDTIEKIDNKVLFELKGSALYGYKVSTDDFTYISFTDADAVHLSERNRLLRTIGLWLCLMTLFAILSFLLAKIMVRPTKKAWDKQQQFIADASHELKTPLAVIMADNNILLSDDSGLKNENRKWVESIDDEAKHMQSLIESMLFLARSDSGTSQVINEDVDFSDLILEDVLQFEPVAYERNITISADVTDNIMLTGDRTQLKMLSHILLDNACKYASENSEIKVSLRGEASGGCVFKVKNEGEPISQKDLPHLFERFYRVDKARTFTDSPGGYGLGLAIAKSICEYQNGSISAESTAASGTVFTAKLKSLKE